MHARISKAHNFFSLRPIHLICEYNVDRSQFYLHAKDFLNNLTVRVKMKRTNACCRAKNLQQACPAIS